MSNYDQRILVRRKRVKERFVSINHDWLVPIQSLRRLVCSNAENPLESLIFPSEESFDSHWQLFLEHQSTPGRIRIGVALLAPRDRCLRADIKLILMTTHGEQTIKENLFQNHLFFLSKGEAISSCINEHISPKVYLDIEDDLYQSIMNSNQQGNLLNTDDCTIQAHVKFMNEYAVEPKTKTFDFSRRFTADWKLMRFKNIIEQINQSRPPAGNNRRLVSDRFQFTHVKIIEGFRTKKWKLSINYPPLSSTNKQIPFNLILKSLNESQLNYGKFEIVCKNEQNVLRRYIDTMEDLADSYPIEFFTLDDLSGNIYKYKQCINDRFTIVDYLLLSIKITQPLQPSDILKKVKRVVEPTIISLNNIGNVRNKTRTKSMITKGQKSKSPVSQEEIHIVRNKNGDDSTFPPIRLRSPSSFRTLPTIARSFMYKPIPPQKQSSASTKTSRDSTDNFTFLANLFRSGLHSDVTIRCQDHQWKLHKSILSARSIYFNQYFANSKETELTLPETISSTIIDKMFLFLYTNQYTSEKYIQLLFQLSIKYGIDSLTQLCLQDMCNQQNLTIKTSANLLIALHQAITDPYAKYHTDDYLNQIKNHKQTILRFIQIHSREVLISSQWKILEKQYPSLVHDVLEFVVFEKIDE